MFKSLQEELAHIASLTDLEVCAEYNTDSRDEAIEVTREYWDYYQEDEEEYFDDEAYRNDYRDDLLIDAAKEERWANLPI